ncbi:MAG: hypothetical protein F6K31_20385 [Symploca sp. SIO2G7]|nr:hypothetical protein [Symploca sp. SIO2G7]
MNYPSLLRLTLMLPSRNRWQVAEGNPNEKIFSPPCMTIPLWCVSVSPRLRVTASPCLVRLCSD